MFSLTVLPAGSESVKISRERAVLLGELYWGSLKKIDPKLFTHNYFAGPVGVLSRKRPRRCLTSEVMVPGIRYLGLQIWAEKIFSEKKIRPKTAGANRADIFKENGGHNYTVPTLLGQ